jgi:hydrogenase nickel incorporation protein HypB
MCQDCGCSTTDHFVIEDVIHPDATHHHTIDINQGILSKNDHLAQHNRHYFQSQGLLTLNVLSSPGSGKTAFIERMLQDYGHHWQMGVIVGDLATDNDAQRIKSKCPQTIQITTGNACHLEAAMIAQAVQKLDIKNLNLLIIENVGNLVCPAAYDLGEDLRIVLLSVTEGEDKPLKYPTMFKSAQVVVINKIDLATVVEFARDQAIANIQKIAPQAKILEVSAKTGQGFDSLWTYLSSQTPKIPLHAH